jgi:5-carboxymethyl-2-hydroxymuconate isomerase
MRLVTYAHGGRASFGVVEGDGVIDLAIRIGDRLTSLKHLIEADGLMIARAAIEGAVPNHALAEVDLLPPITSPSKIFCVGVNYRDRNAEYKDGSEQPKYPSLFMRTAESLVGHGAAIVRPPESEQLDYEGEIVMVIGKAGRRIAQADAAAHVFGLTLMNEGSVRDWLRHGKFNVTQGKNFDRSGSVGPWIVPTGDLPGFDALEVVTRVNGEERQRGSTAHLLFPFARIVEYISTFTTLRPGDLIATGTPTGAGARFDPPKWLVPGDLVEVEAAGIGVLANRVEDERG